jgi:hypothetical protein
MSHLNHARPEYAISLAIFGILLAIGIPALKRGSYILGGIFVSLAALFAIWVIVTLIQQRRGL